MRNPDSSQLSALHPVLPPAPPAVQLQLARITRSLYEVTGENLVGVYLHGSLAMGCFNVARNDIDLLAITHHPLATGAARTLCATLLETSGQPARSKSVFFTTRNSNPKVPSPRKNSNNSVEISILHYAQLKPWRYPTPFDLHFSEMHRGRVTEAMAAPEAKLPTGGLDHDRAVFLMTYTESPSKVV